MGSTTEQQQHAQENFVEEFTNCLGVAQRIWGDKYKVTLTEAIRLDDPESYLRAELPQQRS